MNAQKMNLVTRSVQTLRDHSPVAAGMVLNWMKMDWIVMVRKCVKVDLTSVHHERGRLLCCNLWES